MKLTLTFVSTLNGKITKSDDPDVTKWSSAEDQAHFKEVLKEYKVVIRSSTTYEIAKNNLVKDGSYRYIVLTRDPDKYKNEAIKGVVEFTSESPIELIKRLEIEGVTKALLAAGGTVVSIFFKDKLITDFQLSIEPKLFGKGVPLISESDLFVDLELIEHQKLNDQGTLLLTYKVIY